MPAALSLLVVAGCLAVSEAFAPFLSFPHGCVHALVSPTVLAQSAGCGVVPLHQLTLRDMSLAQVPRSRR